MVIQPACQKGCVGRKVGWRVPGPWSFRRYGGQEPGFGRTLRITLAFADATSSRRRVAFATMMNAVPTVLSSCVEIAHSRVTALPSSALMRSLICLAPFPPIFTFHSRSSVINLLPTRHPNPTQSTPVKPSGYHFVHGICMT